MTMNQFINAISLLYEAGKRVDIGIFAKKEKKIATLFKIIVIYLATMYY